MKAEEQRKLKKRKKIEKGNYTRKSNPLFMQYFYSCHYTEELLRK